LRGNVFPLNILKKEFYMSDRTTKVEMHKQDPGKRTRNFNEVASGYSAREAMEEAKRCLQ